MRQIIAHNSKGGLAVSAILMVAAVVASLAERSIALAVIILAVSAQFFLLMKSDARIEEEVQGVLRREGVRYGHASTEAPR